MTSGQDRSLSGVGLDRGDLVGDPYLTHRPLARRLINAWFNTKAFALAAPGTFGNSPRNLLRAPSFSIWIGRSRKRSASRERFSAQFRGDFFDLLNNPHFNAPGSSVAGTSTFGKISSAGDPRIVQFRCGFGFRKRGSRNRPPESVTAVRKMRSTARREPRPPAL